MKKSRNSCFRSFLAAWGRQAANNHKELLGPEFDIPIIGRTANNSLEPQNTTNPTPKNSTTQSSQKASIVKDSQTADMEELFGLRRYTIHGVPKMPPKAVREFFNKRGVPIRCILNTEVIGPKTVEILARVVHAHTLLLAVQDSPDLELLTPDPCRPRSALPNQVLSTELRKRLASPSANILVRKNLPPVVAYLYSHWLIRTQSSVESDQRQGNLTDIYEIRKQARTSLQEYHKFRFGTDQQFPLDDDEAQLGPTKAPDNTENNSATIPRNNTNNFVNTTNTTVVNIVDTSTTTTNTMETQESDSNMEVDKGKDQLEDNQTAVSLLVNDLSFHRSEWNNSVEETGPTFGDH
jgi:hypothetical protein